MADAWFSCKPCSGSDPTKDTVKVDTSAFGNENAKPTDLNKYENAKPTDLNGCQDIENEKKLEQEKRARDERIRVERDAEGRRKAAEEEAKRRREEQETAAKQAAEEERLRQEAAELARKDAEEMAEKERLRQEAVKRAAEEKAQKEVEEAAEQERRHTEEVNQARKKVGPWCKDNSYKDVHTAKTTLRGNKKFALHTAVKQENPEAVKMLLLCGADKNAKDSKGKTAFQLAEIMKPGKPRETILDLLR